MQFVLVASAMVTGLGGRFTQGVSFGVVHQNRYNTASVKVRQALEAGRFGTIVAASCTMNNYKP
jgi:predicted dehydrogenase